jgi:plastocyanin
MRPSGHRAVWVGAVIAIVALTAPRIVAAQSLLERPPNLSADWVGNSGTIYFNFVHRFRATDAPERKVTNYPTFLFAAGLPYRLLVGFNYATNSDLAQRYPNEWEFFARHQLLQQDAGAFVDLGGQVGYNLAAEGVDGEVSVARRAGAVRLIGGARFLSNAFAAGETRFALTGGGTIRLARYLAIAGDVAHVMDDDAPNSRTAWSAGLHIGIPYTPHTLSLQATNTNVATLQGMSRGGDITRYGFEFTVPFTLRRWFGRPETPPETVAPTAARVDTVIVVQRDTVRVESAPRTDTARAEAPRPAAPADAERRPEAQAPAAAAPTPAAAAPARQPAPARQAPARRTVTVVLRNTTFVPGRVQITAGSTVVWRNDDQLIHTVTANDKSFDSGLLQPGKTYSRTFDKAGQYPYYCLPHPFMKGVVVVR